MFLVTDGVEDESGSPPYNGYIAPFQPNIAANLQNCASPGLFFQVSTDQDISGALTQLFNVAVATAT